MKRLRIFIVGIAMLSLLAPMAFAQQMPSGQPGTSTTSTMTETKPMKELYANDVVGTSVINAAGEKMGKVSELVIDPKEGRITEAVVSFGGFMGLGEKSVAVPWNELTLSPTNRTFTLAMGKEELESAPDWKKPVQEPPPATPPQQRAPLGGVGQPGSPPPRSQ